MQTQQTITKSPVHVKVAHDDEFRRFLLNPITFDNLQTMLKSLFTLESEFRIKFQDDENDWVLLTTDQELVYAAELSGSLLRLQVKLISETPKGADVSSVPQEKERGCFRGRGRRGGKCGLKSRQERLTMKSSRLTERINQLDAKINSNTLPSDRERVLRWRLTKLQEKLAFVQSLKESSTNIPQTPQTPETTETSPVSADVSPVEEQQPKTFGCKGGRCGRGGRGGWRRAMNEDGSDPVRKQRARVAPEIIANFRQCKATLRAAREGGNTEEIQAALEAFRAAKAAKLDALAALRVQEPKGTDEQTA